MTKEQATELNLLLATLRCFTEQLFQLKGTHAGIVKQKFNRLVKVANQYEREVLRYTEDSPELETIYDALMEVLIIVKKEAHG